MKFRATQRQPKRSTTSGPIAPAAQDTRASGSEKRETPLNHNPEQDRSHPTVKRGGTDLPEKQNRRP
ncbi:hypothetical protein ACOSQ4_010041 [Xanthoceras sorbifolium]